jgi:hypothetical protein
LVGVCRPVRLPHYYHCQCRARPPSCLCVGASGATEATSRKGLGSKATRFVRLIQLCAMVIKKALSHCKSVLNVKGLLFDRMRFDNDDRNLVSERRFDIRDSSPAPSARSPLFRTLQEWNAQEWLGSGSRSSRGAAASSVSRISKRPTLSPEANREGTVRGSASVRSPPEATAEDVSLTCQDIEGHSVGSERKAVKKCDHIKDVCEELDEVKDCDSAQSFAVRRLRIR